MSNTIRFNALLLRALVTELAARLCGMRVARAQFERTSRTLLLEAGPRRQPLTLSWSLHPARPHLLLVEGGAARAGAVLQVPAGAPIAAVTHVPDERIVRLELAAGEAAAGIVRMLVIELIGNRWNALALGADDVIMAVLAPRPHDPRRLLPGGRYTLPPARERSGQERPPELPEWHAVLQPVPPAERPRALLATFAYTSPLNVGWILGDAALPEAGDHLLAEAWERYAWLLTAPPQPCLLDGVQPYPQPLGGSALRAPSLLEAFRLAAGAEALPAATGESEAREALRARLHERQEQLRLRGERLRHEAAGAAEEAALLRSRADVLLAQLALVPRGAAEAVLTDFAGRELRLALDPALSAQRNAQAWYEQARRRERAARRVPPLLERAAAELQRLDELAQRLADGSAEAGELEALRRSEPAAQIAALPYRRYRTSGGLEVRVGRNARANDVLTREHAAAEDIWLHARAAAGAHVVLRWGRRDENPPRADLLEAAGLAAWHSRARTSGVVPVDWTRRKHVRKPRKAPPGEVIMERASTLFVEPSAALEQRLRSDVPGE